jgi:hypothetical protein
MCQPLHTTIHYDGRARPDATSPRSGIHNRVDALPEKMEMQPADLARDLKVEPLPRLLPGILAELAASHRLVDRTYQLEAQLPPERGAWTPSPDVVAYATERARASARFTASLYLTAWETSAKLQLPTWLDRAPGRRPPASARR